MTPRTTPRKSIQWVFRPCLCQEPLYLETNQSQTRKAAYHLSWNTKSKNNLIIDPQPISSLNQIKTHTDRAQIKLLVERRVWIHIKADLDSSQVRDISSSCSMIQIQKLWWTTVQDKSEPTLMTVELTRESAASWRSSVVAEPTLSNRKLIDRRKREPTES